VAVGMVGSPSLAEFWNFLIKMHEARIRRVLEYATERFALVFPGRLLPQSDRRDDFWNGESCFAMAFQYSNESQTNPL
jgi:hypothetical protein